MRVDGLPARNRRLRELRRRAGVSQGELAPRLGWSVTSLCGRELGQRGTWTKDLEARYVAAVRAIVAERRSGGAAARGGVG